MPSKEKRAMRKAKLSKAEKKSKKLAYHAEALHYHCRDCHRSYNKKKNLKSGDKNAAPTRCNSCH
jgi:NAD-dependent SIR2 family protein deacetylase